jgi:hypothetical protein
MEWQGLFKKIALPIPNAYYYDGDQTQRRSTLHRRARFMVMQQVSPQNMFASIYEHGQCANFQIDLQHLHLNKQVDLKNEVMFLTTLV